MNIFMYEMKAHRRSALVWTGALVALTVLFMSMFPSISKEITEFKTLLEGFPESIRKALGIQVDTLGTVVGFYSYIFLYISLCGSIQAMNYGLSIGSKEVREKTADFIFTKPVTRTKIITSKIVAAFSNLLFTNAIFIAAAVSMAAFVKTEEYSLKVFMLISLSLLFIQLIFLAVGVVISVVFSRIKSVITVSLGVVFTFFFIGMIAANEESGRYLSPFKYFDNSYIMKHSSYEYSFLFTGMAVILLSLIVSYVIYIKKDIHSV
jgi:ABC-2 type transport system permease protein